MKIYIGIILLLFVTLGFFIFIKGNSNKETTSDYIVPTFTATPVPSPIHAAEVTVIPTNKADITSSVDNVNTPSITPYSIEIAIPTKAITSTPIKFVSPDPTTEAPEPDSSSTNIYGDFEYSISNEEVTIIKYLENNKVAKVPDNIDGYPVTIIGSNAFFHATIADDVIPDSNLEEVNLPDTITKIDDEAFNMCTNLSYINLPEGLTIIGASAFSECYKLNNITLPSSLKFIKKNAFTGCKSLESIVIPEGITTIENYTFGGSGLISVTLPSTLTFIDNCAFTSCEKLTSISIPEGVTTLGFEVFYGCFALESISLPASLTSVGQNAFYCTPWLAKILDRDSMLKIGDTLLKVKTLEPNFSIPIGTKSIGYYAFEACSTTLEQVEFPNGVNEIGYAAFYECKKLSEVVLPDTVTTLEDYAFYSCTELRTIIIPKSVVLIGECTFDKCKNLTIITQKNSYAAVYAAKHKITIQFLD